MFPHTEHRTVVLQVCYLRTLGLCSLGPVLPGLARGLGLEAGGSGEEDEGGRREGLGWIGAGRLETAALLVWGRGLLQWGDREDV